MILKPDGSRGPGARERALWADLLSLGMVFPIAIALGFFIGRWVGGLFGQARAGSLVGLIWGVATGFWELYKVTLRMNRKPGETDSNEAGQGPGADDDQA